DRGAGRGEAAVARRAELTAIARAGHQSLAVGWDRLHLLVLGVGVPAGRELAERRLHRPAVLADQAGVVPHHRRARRQRLPLLVEAGALADEAVGVGGE